MKLRVVVLAALVACRARRDAPTPTVSRAEGVFHRCAALREGGASSWRLADRVVTREGLVARDPRPSSRPATVLVTGGPDGATLPLDPRVLRVGERVARVPVHAAVVLGGMQGDREAALRWFDVVVPRGVPTLLVPGDTDDLEAFRALVDALSRTRPAVMDGTRVRLYAAEDLELATLPGTLWTSLVPRGTAACALDDADAALLTTLPAARAPRLLVTATAPRQAGAAAVDRGVLGVHVGSPGVAALVRTMAPRGVITLLPRESAGTLADLEGAELLDGDLGERPFALSVGHCGNEPVETTAGALLAAGAWVVRLAPDRARVDRLE